MKYNDKMDVGRYSLRLFLFVTLSIITYFARACMIAEIKSALRYVEIAKLTEDNIKNQSDMSRGSCRDYNQEK